MRRLPVVLALILAVVLAVDATAVTRSEHHFKMSFAKKVPMPSTNRPLTGGSSEAGYRPSNHQIDHSPLPGSNVRTVIA